MKSGKRALETTESEDVSRANSRANSRASGQTSGRASDDDWPREMDVRFNSPIEMLSSPRIPDSPVAKPVRFSEKRERNEPLVDSTYMVDSSGKQIQTPVWNQHQTSMQYVDPGSVMYRRQGMMNLASLSP